MSDWSTRRYAWWTPAGWELRAAPRAYIALQLDDNDGSPAESGYTKIDSDRDLEEGDVQELILEVAQHDDRHTQVELWNLDRQLSIFFVASEWSDVFFCTRYLELRRDIERVGGARRENYLIKTLAAFVRHGHGTDVVNRQGTMSREEIKEDRERMLELRRRREDEKRQLAEAKKNAPH